MGGVGLRQGGGAPGGFGGRARSGEEEGRRAVTTCGASNAVRDALLDEAVPTWVSLGKPVFDLDDELTAALLLTDDRVEVSDETDVGDGIRVRMSEWPENIPFDVFSLRLPWNIEVAPGAVARRLFAYRRVIQGERVVGIQSAHIGDCLPACWCETDRKSIVLAPGVCAFVAGFLFWYDSLPEKPRPERKLAYNRRTRAGRETVFRCQSSLKLDRRLVEAAKHYGDPAYKLHARWIVRGHWRNQACGPARAERRMTWVRPHWKGDDALAPVRHIYKAQAGLAEVESVPNRNDRR